MADTTATEIKELVKKCVVALQASENVLRELYQDFTQPNLIDRHGDAPKMAKALKLINDALEAHSRV